MNTNVYISYHSKSNKGVQKSGRYDVKRERKKNRREEKKKLTQKKARIRCAAAFENKRNRKRWSDGSKPQFWFLGTSIFDFDRDMCSVPPSPPHSLLTINACEHIFLLKSVLAYARHFYDSPYSMPIATKMLFSSK